MNIDIHRERESKREEDLKDIGLELDIDIHIDIDMLKI